MDDPASAVKDILDQIPFRFNPDAARGVHAVIQQELTGEGGGSYYTTIADGACAVAAGRHPAPDLTVIMRALDWVELIHGRLNGLTAYMTGRITVTGDMGLAMRLPGLFRR